MSIIDGLQFVLDHPKDYVYIYFNEAVNPWIRLHFWDGRSRNPFHLSPPIIGGVPYFLTVIVRKDAPWRKAVTKKILEQEAAGLMRLKFKPDTDVFMAKFSQVKFNYNSEKEIVAFKVENLIPIGVLMSFLFIVGLVVFFMELVWVDCEKSDSTVHHRIF